MRDQTESAFGTILSALVARLPGARAAALVDFEGETVDYSGDVDPYRIRLAAAHWRVVLDDIKVLRGIGPVGHMIVRAAQATYLLRGLSDGYALVVVYGGGAALIGCKRAIPAFARALENEAGWNTGRRPAGWHLAEVSTAGPGEDARPSSIRAGKTRHALEVLGSIAVGLTSGERGWRVRTLRGSEATLVREPGGYWYSDEQLAERAEDG